MDKGIKRVSKNLSDCARYGERAWFRKRHEDIAKGVEKSKTAPNMKRNARKRSQSNNSSLSDTSSSDTTSSTSSSIALERGHRKELDFQRDKLKRRKMECYEQGTLLPHEVPTSERTEFEAMIQKQKKTDAQRSRKEQRIDAATNPKPFDLQSFRGRQVYVDKSLVDPDFRNLLASKRLLRSETKVGAELFIVPNPGRLGMRIRWAAVLGGAAIASPDVIKTGRGPVVQYAPAVTTKRAVWVSSAFRAAHPAVFDIIKGVTDQMWASKWTVEDGSTDADFRNLKARTRGSVVGLLTNSEAEVELHFHCGSPSHHHGRLGTNCVCVCVFVLASLFRCTLSFCSTYDMSVVAVRVIIIGGWGYCVCAPCQCSRALVHSWSLRTLHQLLSCIGRVHCVLRTHLMAICVRCNGIVSPQQVIVSIIQISCYGADPRQRHGIVMFHTALQCPHTP